jgi:hypothetical protein
MVLTFGKYKGYDLNDVPANYLIWAFHHATCLDSGQRQAIAGNLIRRGTSTEELQRGAGPKPSATKRPGVDAQAVADAVRDGIKEAFRECSMRHHPDHGGSNEAQRALNDFKETLDRTVPPRIQRVADEAGRPIACKGFPRKPGEIRTTVDRSMPIAKPIPLTLQELLRDAPMNFPILPKSAPRKTN